jgi:hypothetical protein
VELPRDSPHLHLAIAAETEYDSRSEMKIHATTTASSSLVVPNVVFYEHMPELNPGATGFMLQWGSQDAPSITIQVEDDLPEASKIVQAIDRFVVAAEAYMDAFDEERLTESVMYGCMWSAKDARNMVMDVIDKEMAAGDPNGKAGKLQDIVDTLSSYVQDCLKMQMDEEQAQKDAMMTYQDDGMADSDQDGNLVNEEKFQEAILNASQRRKHATIVRTKKDGTKEHKFPIPDKAHARAALSRLNQSDLTPEEKAKVKRRAYRVLGQSPSKKTKEAATGVDEITALGEAEDGTIGGSMDDLQLVTIGEATKFDLQKGELEITFIQPGLNKSGQRYYPKETIAEGIGLFSGKKMFLNHASLQELSQRPERSLTEWVSTIKETWVDPSTGAGKAKVKVVQTWFKNFLKDLQEAGALPDIGVSIFATGKTKPGTINGKSTNIVEKFQNAMSVDWVTEPGAGGRVDAIWESHRPLMIKEQELNVLESLKPAEALAQIKESRPDIYEAVRQEFAETAQTEAEKAAQEAERKATADKIAELEAKLKESDESAAKEKTQRIKVQHEKLVQEALKESKLPDVTKARITAQVGDPVLTEDGELDEAKVKESVGAAIKSEEDYLDAMLKAAGQGKGIQGLGESVTTTTTGIKESANNPHDRVMADLEKRLGLPAEKTEAKA